MQVLGAFALHELTEFGHGHGGNDCAGGFEARLDVGLGKHAVNLLIQPVDDGLWGAARGKKTGPKREIVVLDSRYLSDGRLTGRTFFMSR